MMHSDNDINKYKSLSVKLLGVLYVLVLLCLVLNFRSENDQFVIPIYYLVIVGILQLSFVLYYKVQLKSASMMLLLVIFILLIGFCALFYYLTGLAAAFKN